MIGGGFFETEEEFEKFKEEVKGYYRGEPYRGEFAPDEEARSWAAEAFREQEAEAERRKAAPQFGVIDGGRK